MNIIEQIKELRKLSEDIKFVPSLRKIFSESADTIESLSAKLQAANMERQANFGNCGSGCLRWDSMHGGCTIHNTVPGGCKDFCSVQGEPDA